MCLLRIFNFLAPPLNPSSPRKTAALGIFFSFQCCVIFTSLTNWPRRSPFLLCMRIFFSKFTAFSLFLLLFYKNFYEDLNMTRIQFNFSIYWKCQQLHYNFKASWTKQNLGLWFEPPSSGKGVHYFEPTSSGKGGCHHFEIAKNLKNRLCLLFGG